jgi:hypothetical protein
MSKTQAIWVKINPETITANPTTAMTKIRKRVSRRFSWLM